MTSEEIINGQRETEDFATVFPKVFAKLVIRMQEVDDWCVQMTQDISKQDLLLIEFIGNGQDIIMRDISEFLDAPHSTATGIVDKLVKKNYLKRYYSEEDRRTIRVGLTKKASELTTLFCEKKKETSEVIARLLTSDEQGQLISIFEKIDRKF